MAAAGGTYRVLIEPLYATGRLKPNELVRAAKLVKPAGAVDEASLLWIKVEFFGERAGRLIAVPLSRFYDFIVLPLETLSPSDDSA